MANEKATDKPKSAEERMLDIQERQIALQEEAVKTSKAQLRQTQQKSNASPPLVSAFNPQGEKDYPMPRLKCEVFMPFSQTPQNHGFDREEVELLNLLIDAGGGEFDVELNNGDMEHVVVTATINRGTKRAERLVFSRGWDEDAKQWRGLFTQDNKQTFSSTKKMLRDMLGDKANGVMGIKEQTRRTLLPEDDPKHLPVSVGM